MVAALCRFILLGFIMSIKLLYDRDLSLIYELFSQDSTDYIELNRG